MQKFSISEFINLSYSHKADEYTLPRKSSMFYLIYKLSQSAHIPHNKKYLSSELVFL